MQHNVPKKPILWKTVPLILSQWNKLYALWIEFTIPDSHRDPMISAKRPLRTRMMGVVVRDG